jgi:hypothetical protein
MIEPQLLEPELPEAGRQVTKAPNATPVRLLDTQARGHIGRRVLHQQPNGELTQDSVWRWSSAPDRYLDTALRLEVASRPDVRLVDADRAPWLAATLLVWDLESEGRTRFVGVVEFQITGTDHVLHTQVVRASEPVSTELPGDLAVVAGRLLRRFASEGLTFVASEQHPMKWLQAIAETNRGEPSPPEVTTGRPTSLGNAAGHFNVGGRIRAPDTGESTSESKWHESVSDNLELASGTVSLKSTFRAMTSSLPTDNSWDSYGATTEPGKPDESNWRHFG